jgi:hypothetical protein
MNPTWKLFSVLVCLFALCTCRSTGLVGGQCTERLVECSGECVNLAADNENCGECGTVCKSNQSCRLGQCLAGRPPVGTASAGGSNPVPDSDADTGTPEAGTGLDASDDTGPGPTIPVPMLDGAVDQCIPPFESAERCGACDVSCGPEAPYCGDLGEGYVCVTGCPPDQNLCADRCTYVDSDEWNCGRCGVVCPTGICRDSQCVGGHAGHLVVACSSYEQAFASSPQTVLLGNAVFLTSERSRVMLFERYSNGATRAGVRKVLNWAQAAHAGVVDLTTVATESALASTLNPQDFDVLLLADPNVAPTGALRAMGQTIQGALDTFMVGGGTVVVMNGSTSSEIVDFLGSQGANLLEVRGMTDVTFTELDNRSPGDSLAANVLSPFLGLTTTCIYDTDVMSGPDINVVIAGAPADGGAPGPVVLHRVISP